MHPRIRAISVAAAVVVGSGGLAACQLPTPSPIPQLSAPKSAEAGSRAADAARSQVGAPYVYGGSSPSVGFDCSGLTSWAWAQAGTTIPRSSSAQYGATARISRSDLRAGDLVFYGYSGQVSHVAIYVGDGQIVQARNPRFPVSQDNVDTYWLSALIGYGRIASN